VFIHVWYAYLVGMVLGALGCEVNHDMNRRGLFGDFTVVSCLSITYMITHLLQWLQELTGIIRESRKVQSSELFVRSSVYL